MDRDILRPLAAELAEIAALDIHDENRKLYRGVNSLHMIRPVVLLDELPWNQLNGDGELTLRCEDEFLRSVEHYMRRTLWKWKHCPGDMIIDPFYALTRCVSVGPIGPDIREETRELDKGNNIISHAFIDQMDSEEALELIQMPEIVVDDALTEKRREILDGIFGNILPIRVTGISGGTYFCPWDTIARWRGVESIYVDLYDDPELLHAIMRRYVDIGKAILDKEEALGLLDDYQPVLHCTAGLADELPGEKPDGKVTRKNMWGRGMAQCFSSVSPAMHDEFDIKYMQEYFEGFGLTYYGCCEPLHDKIDIVKKLPNIRKISITPWADVRKAAERMGSGLVLSRKPNPAAVAVPALNEEALRRDILETLSVCRENGTPCEFILKDISSVHHNPMNLTRWEQVVMETVRNFG